jgi:hypothetical protein
MENNEDYRAEEQVQSDTPGNDAPMTTAAMAGLEEVKNDPLADNAQLQQAHERAMFERYVKEQGEKIPGNFKSAGEWFDSLKGAQAQFTQGQQEIADLKRQYAMTNNTDNPDYVAPEPEAPTSAEEVASPEPELNELRIPEPEVKDETPQEAPTARVTDADYQKWQTEVATTGTLADATRKEIMNKTGFTPAMVDDYLSAQQAKRRQAFASAAEVVGGGDKLSKILRWAANNFVGEQLQGLQAGLAGPNSELTLRGLVAAFDQANPVTEPAGIDKTAVTPSTAQAAKELPGYKSMAEYRMDMSNPRFKRDDAFRMAVETRAARTDWRNVK